MSPIGDINDTSKADSPWTSSPRPGKLGVDYDHYGAEMAPNARVWKKYVEETDSIDKELVDGWNKSLDVILIFAALFSAILSAFVIESSKDLKPDYSKTSAETLLLMSQILSGIARASPANESITITAESAEFTPEGPAVIVNTLWFLSLSLSVGVSLISILAKEWCYSFLAGRVGTTLRQARLRQQRWDGIQRWRMTGILYLLPLLMHISLLFFAVGMSFYLWDVNKTVAGPVVATTCVTGSFYVVSTSLPLFFRFCPYTTALVRFLYPYWIGVLKKRRTKDVIRALVTLVAWLSHIWKRLKQLPRPLIRIIRPQTQLSGTNDMEAGRNRHHPSSAFSFSRHFVDAQESVESWVNLMRGMILTDRLQLVERETPMDIVTSSMISWMVANCEDSKSVDMALRALAGAELRLLPRQPLWDCGTVLLVCQRLNASKNALQRLPTGSQQSVHDALLEDISLYSRSLGFLTEFIRGEGLGRRTGSSIWIHSDSNRSLKRLQSVVEDVYECVVNSSSIILNHDMVSSAHRYEIAAYAFNVNPIAADKGSWNQWSMHQAQCTRQWALLQLITTGKVNNPSTNAVLSLVNAITKTYLYDPSELPILLIHLLDITSQEDSPVLRHAIAVGLTIAAFANHDYPGGEQRPPNVSLADARLRRAIDAYSELITRQIKQEATESLLWFGSLGLLTHQTENPSWNLTKGIINTIGQPLARIGFVNWEAYPNMIPTLPVDFGGGQHLAQVVSGWLSVATRENDPNSEPYLTAIACLDTVLSESLCTELGEHIILPLTEHFTASDSFKLKNMCLQGIGHSVSSLSLAKGPAFDQLARARFLEPLLQPTATNDEQIIPYCMRFLWAIGKELVANARGPDEDRHAAVPILLQSLYNRFTTRVGENKFPESMDDIGLADLWLTNLTNICRNSPQNIFESKVLKFMISFYKRNGNRDLRPRIRPAELPRPFKGTWSWFRILRYLKDGCRTAMERQQRRNEQLVEVHEFGAPWDEQSGNERAPSKDLYWSL